MSCKKREREREKRKKHVIVRHKGPVFIVAKKKEKKTEKTRNKKKKRNPRQKLAGCRGILEISSASFA